MAAAGLAENQPPSDDPASPSVRPSLTGGVDLVTAYYFRGYLQADNGPIVQPYLNLLVNCPCGGEVVVRPYVAFFHSSQPEESDGMRDMSDVMLGAIAGRRGFVIDGRYAYYNTSPTMRSAVHELGLRASVDILYPWSQPESPGGFSLRPFAGLYLEASDENGTEDGYLETGLEAAWRFEVCGRKVGLSLPLVCGLSVDDYYFDDRGRNETLGYFSAGAAASVALPVPEGCGEWFMNVTFQYLHLFADNLVALNGGDRDEFIGRIGIGLLF